jgi:hypothetical protein
VRWRPGAARSRRGGDIFDGHDDDDHSLLSGKHLPSPLLSLNPRFLVPCPCLWRDTARAPALGPGFLRCDRCGRWLSVWLVWIQIQAPALYSELGSRGDGDGGVAAPGEGDLHLQVWELPTTLRWPASCSEVDGTQIWHVSMPIPAAHWSPP